MSDVCFLPATELVRLIRERDLSCTEVMHAHVDQIERVNPQVNALVALNAERALERAARADAAIANRDEIGPLHGLPIAHKDLVPTKDFPTTSGSPIYRNHVPDEDALIVERLRDAGAIAIGKTNTPEFGAGSQTYNEVYGETLNPYDTSKTCGGSSGGAAVALACGMLPVADGSDTGGSLRNPAAFCNVVGFRPSPGRVPVWPADLGWFPISVQGPMARTVGDVGLLLSAMAGADDRSPISLTDSPELFRSDLSRDFRGVTVSWSVDFGGLPVDSRIVDAMNEQRGVFESLGCVVEDGQPDFADADECFKVWRAWRFELKFADLLSEYGDQIKDTIHWNAAAGARLTGPEIARTEMKRTALYHRVREFMQTREFMIFPVTQAPPFDVRQRYIEEINGVPMQTYIDWMKSCYYITVTGLPAISVPCGFTDDGLPVGLQIVGRHRQDFAVLQLACAFEQATGFWKHRPAVCG